eukprot:COSAG04_NODE_5969_length_1446_cov_1.485523_2_plen_146_part_00
MPSWLKAFCLSLVLHTFVLPAQECASFHESAISLLECALDVAKRRAPHGVMGRAERKAKEQQLEIPRQCDKFRQQSAMMLAMRVIRLDLISKILSQLGQLRTASDSRPPDNRQQVQSQRLANTLRRWQGRCWAVVLHPPNNKSLN